jgi:hypothetical protein
MIRTLFREANKPEPNENINRNGWVSWGDDNLYPQFLNSLAEDNPVHGGIINQKVKFITAGGFTIDGDQNVLNSGFGGYGLQEVIDIACKDFEISDRFALFFKKSLRTNTWEIKPLDFELIRDTENGIFYDYSEDWSVQRQSPEKTGYKKIKNIHYVTESDTECVFVYSTRSKQRTFGDKRKTVNKNYYPTPNYSGAITSIMAGIEMDFFTYSEVVNGWKGGTLINLSNGIPDSPQEEDKIIKRVKNEASKRNTQGGLTVTFSDGKDRAPEVHQISGNDLDKRYIESNKEVLRKIMIAHGVISPALFGVLSETLFGSKEEMLTAYVLFQENYVQHRQDKIANAIEWAFKRLNGWVFTLNFESYIPSVLKESETTPQAEPTQMKKEDKDVVLEALSKVGRKRSEFNVTHSDSFNGLTDKEIKQAYIKQHFAGDLTDDQKVILDMIKKGESYDAISKALGNGGVYLSEQLLVLGSEGLLDGWELTNEGQTVIITEEEIQVLYSYEKKPSAPDLVPGGKSRPFCEALISLDRLYTREEINAISAQVGRDVWSYRGGWYHNPDTGVNTPSCRHEWRQNIIL